MRLREQLVQVGNFKPHSGHFRIRPEYCLGIGITPGKGLESAMSYDRIDESEATGNILPQNNDAATVAVSAEYPRFCVTFNNSVKSDER